MNESKKSYMIKYSEDFRSPGEAIKYCLDKKDWTQEDLAQILSISPKHTNELIKNKKPLSLELILDISRAFSFKRDELQEFVKLYATYKLQNIESEDSDFVTERARLFDKIPVTEMVKKGWMEKTNDFTRLVSQCKEVLGLTSDKDLLNSLVEIEEQQKLHYRKSENNNFERGHAILWRKVAETKATKLEVPRFDKASLKQLLENLHHYTIQKKGVANFIHHLSETGVRFVYLSHLSKTYIDGAAFRSESGPVIAMTGRYDRLDNFWFTIAHEIIHVLNHLHSPTDFFLDDSTQSKSESLVEREANQGASKALRSDEVLEWFRHLYGYLPKEELMNCSKKLELHPSCIVGVLAYNEKTSWSTVQRFKETVREKIPQDFIFG